VGIVKRNNLDICADILKVSRGGAKKTHLVYRANLNFKIVKRYLNELMESELLESDGDMFYLTEKGSWFIERYDSLMGPSQDRGLNGGIWT
jgi:predicted transcriptional regulator